MNARYRAAITVVIVLAAGIAGWCTVHEPDNSRKPAVLPALPAKKQELPPPDSLKPNVTSAAALAAMEKELLLALDPGAGGFTGERLIELCREDRALPYAKAWAAKHPREMFQWFQRRGSFEVVVNDKRRLSSLDIIFREWTQQDPDAAVAAARSLTNSPSRATAMAEVIRVLSKSDGARAAALAAEHLSLLAGERIPVFFGSGPDHQAQLSLLRGLPEGEDRAKVLAGFLKGVLNYHMQEMPRIWKELPQTLQRELVAYGFPGAHPGSYPTLDGLAELQREHFEQTGNRDAARRFLKDGAREWAQRDPAAAVAWVQQHLKGEQRVDGMAQLFSAAAQGKFDTAAQLWQSLPDGVLRARAAGHLAAGAPAERKAEMDALLATLSPADRTIAGATRKTAEEDRRKRDSVNAPLQDVLQRQSQP